MPNELLVALGQSRPVFWKCDDKKSGRVPQEFLTVPDIELAKIEGMGVFFCVNGLGDVPNKNGNLRYNGNVLWPLACFADFDRGTHEEQMEKILSSPLEVSAIVKSGHGYHVYWILEGTGKDDLLRWEETQKAIAQHFGSDASVHDISRIMRLPGSYHCKDSEAKLVTLEKCEAGIRYSLDDLAEAFGKVKKSWKDGVYVNEVAEIIAKPTEEGGRFAASQKFIGAMLNRFPPHEWESHAWPLVRSWNENECIPPKPERVVRSVFNGIADLEKQKRAAEVKQVITFAEGEMIPVISEDGDSIIVEIPTKEGLARFDFSNVEQTKSDTLNVMLTVEHLVLGSRRVPYTQRVNLFSQSGMEGLSRILGKTFGKTLPWELLLNTAQSALVKYLANLDRSVDLSEVEDQETPLLFAPFLVENGANMLFGDGGTGKTFFCLRLALSLATGKPFLGFKPKEPAGTLFIDYEDNAKSASYRLSRLCADPALGLDPVQAKKFIRYFNPQGAPLASITPALKKIIREHHIGLVLVDSVASACGSEPEKAESAAQYYNALQTLGVTSLSIAHVPKTEGGKQDKAFGSVFWHNLARNTWNIQGEEDKDAPTVSLEAVGGDKSRQLRLFHRKFNGGAKSPTINLKITYGERDVRFSSGNSAFWDKDKKAEGQVLESLRLQDGQTATSLGDELPELPVKTLKNVLSVMKKKGLIRKDETRGGKYWVVAPTGGSSNPPYDPQ